MYLNGDATIFRRAERGRVQLLQGVRPGSEYALAGKVTRVIHYWLKCLMRE